LLLSRSLDNANNAIENEIKKMGYGNYTVTDYDIKVVVCDLNDLDSIKKCADEILQEERIDFLINNAGIMAPPKKLITKYGWEMQMATNHYGHWYLTSLLMPKMKSQNFESRIINVSSLLHEKCAFDIDDLHYEKRTYNAWMQYGNTKLANNLFTQSLVEKCAGSNVLCYSLHPGVIKTGLIRHNADENTCIGSLFLLIGGFFVFDKNIPQGASTTLYSCVCNAPNGSYFTDCNIKQSSVLSNDKALRDKLWEITERDIATARFNQK
jgi:retinol dehydrogenase-13